MSSPNLRIRRATMDDFLSLKSLWNSMHFPAGELEKRLTEFQVVEAADGQIVGAIGVQIIRQHALLHSEGYTDFAVADAARQLFWERIQTIAAHHGVF
jgi:N-acetylglutamate synthase-like GNAT family acetyltransferase